MNHNHEYMAIDQSLLKDTTISISGYRHSSNLLMSAAVILPSCHFIFTNMPDVLDTRVMLTMLKQLGAECSYEEGTVNLNTRNMRLDFISEELSKQIHGSIYLIPALLARFGEVNFGQSGGCQIGSQAANFKRPAEHIYAIVKKFGADVRLNENDLVCARVNNLCSAEIHINEFSYEKDVVTGPLTSGATKTAVLMALAIKNGKTIIHNPFLKSEIIDLLEFVQKCGYQVVCNKDVLTIEHICDVENVDHHVISDPSEIITYIALSGYHDIEIQLTNITLDKTWPIIEPEIQLLEKMGMSFNIKDQVLVTKKVKDIEPQDVVITPSHICTDHHPFIMALLLKAKEISSIKELVWFERFQYVPELLKFGIKIEQTSNTITIYPSEVKPANENIIGHDLRSAAMLVIIALGAPGKTFMRDFSHLGRGYVKFIDNLIEMGAKINFS